ncbi:MAG: FtsW/RodA/SpoVE family cell cycle protein [Gammaproteobacteria bacterium]
MILYLAGYMVRRSADLSSHFVGFLKPMLLISLAAGLLLAEPDFGAATVLVATALAMLFAGGARIRDFLVFFLAAVLALAVLAITSPYRMRRLTAFLNPWEDPYDSGFQLTQSLIAIGRGEWFGVGPSAAGSGSAWGSGRAFKRCSTCRRPTPTSSTRSSQKSSACSAPWP